MLKVFVGLPVYDGKLQYQLVDCLLAEIALGMAAGVRLSVRFLPSCTNLAFGRNQLVKEFLASGDDKLIFLDADVTFEPGDLVRLAQHQVDFVGGAYRLKQDDERYPVYFLNEPKEMGPNGLGQVAMVPTGFLALTRKVFADFEAAYPDRHYYIDGHKNYCYFQIPYAHGALFTEDSYFCREWREAGGKIYLDPKLNLTHWNFNIPYRGNVGKWIEKLRTPEVTA
jgi:glycosyltransferase involved in cell wall biosynthesis